uniref:Uncharacterized protein n=1 Tax=Timema douglasi TaxID=61478 RepID=A0A7R8Z4V3_TIMDO|nr:unnamed protein product [Timema douglasi]
MDNLFPHNKCRLCGLVKTEVLDLYSTSARSKGLLSKVNKLLPKEIVHIVAGDGLPKFVCLDCEMIVNSFAQFSARVQDVQKLLETEKLGFGKDNSQLDEIRSNHVNEFVMKDPSIDCTLRGTNSIRESPTVTVGPDNKVECMLCQCFLEAAEHTTLHMVTHGIGTIVCRCRVCGQQGDLSYFQQTGESEGLIFCHACFLASNKAKRQNNVGHTSNLRLHVCDICSKGFQLRGHLTRHKLIHSGAKPYLCEVCGKGFSQKSSLKLHKQSHAGMNPHTCHQCGQKFRFKVSLLSHILSLHGTSGGDAHFFKNKVSKLPHTCDVCGRKFATLYKIRRHYRSHTKDRPYKCERCGRLFSQSGNLNLHKKKHEDDGNVTTQTFDVPLLVQFMPLTNRDGVMHPKCTEVVLSHQLSTLEPPLLNSSVKNQDHTTRFDPSLRPQFEQTSSEYMVSLEGTIKDKNTDTELFSPFSHDGLLFIDEGAGTSSESITLPTFSSIQAGAMPH